MKIYRRKSSVDYIVIIIGILIIVLLLYLIFFNKNEYEVMEDRLVSSAKNYVSNNHITTNQEIYFSSSKLGVELTNNCSIISGVIYNGNSYIPYLSCPKYESKIINGNENVKDYISLRGNEVVVIAKGMEYYDPGYISNDIVIKAGEIGTEEGIYNLYYKTNNSNKTAMRKVIIVDDNNIKNLYPTITLKGENHVYVAQNNTYQDSGAEAFDTVDGNISNKIIIENNVNTSVVDEYKVNYVITNSRGYTNVAIRTVNVINRNSDLAISYSLNPSKLTNEDVIIKLNISGEFDYILYPDGSKGKSLEYKVMQNDIYKFKIYDIYGREVVREIMVNNIDKTVPQGSCVAELYYDRTEVKVNIDSTRKISSYDYILDNNTSGSLQTNSYVSNIIKPTLVKVKIKDILNNQKEISCNIINKSERKIVTDNNGKNCLEGLSCYIQFNYGNSSKYPFCSMSNNPNSCGGIGRNGCSITSASNAIAAMGIKSQNGSVYNPYTVWEELYQINKSSGQCNGGCSSWTRIREAIINAGLSATKEVGNINANSKSTIIAHLQKGWPIVVWADTGAFTGGRHYMTLLGVREDGYVFLSDSANKKGINKSKYNGRQYYVDTWIPYEDLISGQVKEYMLVGPPGVYEGK